MMKIRNIFADLRNLSDIIISSMGFGAICVVRRFGGNNAILRIILIVYGFSSRIGNRRYAAEGVIGGVGLDGLGGGAGLDGGVEALGSIAEGGLDAGGRGGGGDVVVSVVAIGIAFVLLLAVHPR